MFSAAEGRAFRPSLFLYAGWVRIRNGFPKPAAGRACAAARRGASPRPGAAHLRGRTDCRERGLLTGSRLREIGRRPMKKCRAGLQKQRETHTIKASQL